MKLQTTEAIIELTESISVQSATGSFSQQNNMFTRDKRRALGPFLNLTIWLIQDRSSNSSIIEKQQRNFKTTLLSSLLLIQLK